MGSALKIVRLAEGAGDLYPRFGRTMEWDTAAPQAVLEAAGGRLCDMDGAPLRYGKPGWENPPFVCTGLPAARDRAAARRRGRDRARPRALLLAGRTGRVRDRDGLRAGRGRDATRAPSPRVFDGQGAAAFQPADLPLSRRRGGVRRCRGDEAARAAWPTRFWPGPLTMVLPRRVTCPVALLAGAGLETLAVRVPAQPAALALLRGGGRAGRGAVGQPVGPGLAHHGRACAGRAGGADRRGAGQRPLRGRAWRARCSTFRRARRSCCGRAGCRWRRSRRCIGADRARDHAGGGGGDAQPALAGAAGVALRAWPAGPAARDAAAAGRGAAGLRRRRRRGRAPYSSSARRGTWPRRRPGCSRGCAGWTPRGRAWGLRGIAVAPVPDTGLGLRDQRPAAAGGGAAIPQHGGGAVIQSTAAAP